MSAKTRNLGYEKTEVLQAQTLSDIITLPFVHSIRKAKKAFNMPS